MLRSQPYSYLKCPCCGGHAQLFRWAEFTEFVACYDCVALNADSCFTIEATPKLEEIVFSAIIDIPPIYRAVAEISDDEVADFVRWSSLVRSFVRSR